MAAFVDEPQRFVQFVARRLVDAAMQSAGERGCREFASDALLNNLASAPPLQAPAFRTPEFRGRRRDRGAMRAQSASSMPATSSRHVSRVLLSNFFAAKD
jgi:hypothetical protein